MQGERPAAAIASVVFPFSCGGGKLAIRLLTVLIYHSTFTAKGNSCPSTKGEIDTDRPDVTNSSLVVPASSLQSENGINLSQRDGGRLVDGTNTRLRAGISTCLEFLVDLPTYVANVRAPDRS